MGHETGRRLRRWKVIAGVAIATDAFLLAALIVLYIVYQRRPAPQTIERLVGSSQSDADRKTDERLIGTWQSDADRTIAALRERRPVDAKQEAALRKLFGKLRVTYTSTAFTTELDGVTESGRYEVLGRDKRSVVIREVESKPSLLEVSEFTVIYFDSPDSYWLYTKIGDVQEYFIRIK
jgi:hypothetical protein